MPPSGKPSGSGDLDYAYEHARRTDDLFPRLWLPGGWGGQFGAYQSQLKALMKMLGQPGGEVRPPAPAGQ